MARKPIKRKQQGTFVQRAVRNSRNAVGNLLGDQSPELKTLLSIIFLMAILGFVMVYSSSYVDSVKNTAGPFTEARSQGLGLLAGTVALVWLANLKPELTKRLGPILLVIFLGLQLLVLFTPLGRTVNGNRNWLYIGPFSLQPSEFLKIALIMMVANMIVNQANFHQDDIKFWMPPTVLFGGIFLLVGLMSKDMGTMIVMALILYGMFFMGGISNRLFKWISLVALAGIPLIMMMGGSRKGRILAWLFPWQPDPNQYNWQADHGKWAFAAGGLFGKGLGKSEMKWSWVPEAQNDFIFAIIGEEFGLLGAVVVILMFVFMGITLMRIARKTRDQYQRMFVYGVTFWIMAQAFINISVVLTMLPVLGVNLPLISAGGTSMVSTLMALGMVLGIERNNYHQAHPKFQVIKGGRRA